MIIDVVAENEVGREVHRDFVHDVAGVIHVHAVEERRNELFEIRHSLAKSVVCAALGQLVNLSLL